MGGDWPQAHVGLLSIGHPGRNHSFILAVNMPGPYPLCFLMTAFLTDEVGSTV
ncbi:hypothetical protein SCLCIDRAFT_1209969 [Scleroderma citrinum Foug A]|uniref:Uncharacterized protein n=1 Tax=Scleroderma citrinum Foug A TaxID=1036808 RepID=A0A0C3E4V0_9AGAM|nr:hypothetical protein SCLCIDRAFT_1209969 [Scleroderma citrinum Foug A]